MSLPTVKTSFSFWRRPPGEPEPVATSTARPQEHALKVVLLIGDYPTRPLAAEISQRLVLGRGGEGEGEGPDIDLTPFGGQHFGVSRRHAALVHRNGMLFVEDLNSTNGTRLNGLLLGRGASFRLRNNDELELGSLRMQVRAVPRLR